MTPTRPLPRQTPGFSLVELLTVIAVIAILGSILFVVSGNVRESVYASESASNLRTLHNAAMLYASENNGILPPQSESNSNGNNSNFLLALRDAGLIVLKQWEECQGDHYMFNPASASVRTPLPSNANGYSININITAGRLEDGVVTRGTATSGYLNRIESQANTAMFMDARWNGLVWPVQIGRVSGNSPINAPSFPHPSSSIGTEDPDAFSQVVFVDGHVQQIPRRDWIYDTSETFWNGLRD